MFGEGLALVAILRTEHSTQSNSADPRSHVTRNEESADRPRGETRSRANLSGFVGRQTACRRGTRSIKKEDPDVRNTHQDLFEERPSPSQYLRDSARLPPFPISIVFAVKTERRRARRHEWPSVRCVKPQRTEDLQERLGVGGRERGRRNEVRISLSPFETPTHQFGRDIPRHSIKFGCVGVVDNDDNAVASLPSTHNPRRRQRIPSTPTPPPVHVWPRFPRDQRGTTANRSCQRRRRQRILLIASPSVHVTAAVSTRPRQNKARIGLYTVAAVFSRRR